MMNETNLQDVLEEYAIAEPTGNNLATLRQMTEKYPQFAAELQDFAAARALVKYAPEEELNAGEEVRYREVGLNNLRAVLSGKAVQVPTSLQSLTDAAKTKGLNRSKFAAALGLSVSLVQYLEKRRLEFASIPQAVIAKVAEVLETGEELVVNYLKLPPNLVTNASFKANERPEEMQPKSFDEAVREDQTLSGEEKRKLLEL
jgi:transcriptional regulator with XRE-family HTH domain